MLHRTPIAILQPYIESIWYCSTFIATPKNTLSLPLGKKEMVINLSGDYQVKYPGREFEKMDNWIAGQHTIPVIHKISGQHECLGIVFTSLGYNALTKMPSSELANGYLPAENILGKELISLLSVLRELISPSEKLQYLEGIILTRITKLPDLSTIKQALYLIHNTTGKKKNSVSDLCQELKVSRNALNKHFKKYIGISASSYVQVRVFNRVISELANGQNERLVSLAYEHEFFDQAHFIKHFRRFAGMAPGQYLELLKNKSIDQTAPNFISC